MNYEVDLTAFGKLSNRKFTGHYTCHSYLGGGRQRHYPYGYRWFFLLNHPHIILKHGRKECFIEYPNGGDGAAKKEADANRYAADYLIPKDEFRSFAANGDFSVSAIQKFAHQNKVHAGIVVGRLQHEKMIRQSYLNNLKLLWEVEMD